MRCLARFAASVAVLSVWITFPLWQSIGYPLRMARQATRKATGSGMVFDFRCAKLVQCPTRQPAPKPGINGFVAQSEKARRGARALQTFETALQPRKRGSRIRHNVPIMF